MLHVEHRRQMEIELETHECTLPSDELARIQEPLDKIAEAVEELPANLKLAVIYHPRSERYHVEGRLHLPRRTLFASEWDPYLDTALLRSLRSLLRKIEEYKAEPDRQQDAVKQRVESMHREIIAPEDPEAGPLAEVAAAAKEGDYRRFRQLLANYEDWLRLRIGRWIQRYPAANDQLGKRFTLEDLVEEVYLTAMQRYAERPANTRLSDWLDDLIDPSLRALFRNAPLERDNINQVRSFAEMQP